MLRQRRKEEGRMLRSVRLKNFRSFEDTGDVDLRRLNVLIGANNAGKTSFLSAVELFLRSGSSTRGGRRPLAFEEMPAFASFDSVLRRHWSRREQRPHDFSLFYTWSGGKHELVSQFLCQGDPQDNTAYVARATYEFERRGRRSRLSIRPTDNKAAELPSYRVTIGGSRYLEKRMFFHGILPIPVSQKWDFPLEYGSRFVSLEVVHPHRPVPRSFYVADDPGLAREDRDLLTFLIRVWSAGDSYHRLIRQRIIKSLETLNLARTFDVVSPHVVA
jgi:AAA ATPase domain